MKCDICYKIDDNLLEAQFAVGSTGFICPECAKKENFVLTPNPVWGGDSYCPQNWCALTKGLRQECPKGVAYCGQISACDETE